jgi:hypothetical protein
MSKRMVGRTAKILAGLVFLPALGACDRPQVAYSKPGWYLEKPHQLVVAGPQIFAGPMSYEQCEIERKKLPPATAENALCIRELAPPGPNGPY